MKKIAIIGTAPGQAALYKSARELGFYTIGFSWEASEELLKMIDKFYQISIKEKDEIVQKCREEGVCGVVTNGSELTIRISSYVAEKLNLTGTPYDTILNIQNKYWVREHTKNIEGLIQIQHYLYEGIKPQSFPCIIKPISGGGKRGVSLSKDKEDFASAIEYAKLQNQQIMIEEYIEGAEVSVESISYKGQHFVIQITDKENSGPPHFVELSHHQPSQLPEETLQLIRKVVPEILNKVSFTNGATHIELKINKKGIYLIEINPRGGGDEISNRLVELSTDYNYIAAMVKVASNTFETPIVKSGKYSGIYFLTNHTKDRLPFFLSAKYQKWYVDGAVSSVELIDSKGNSEKNGFVIYNSDHKISPNL